MTSQLDRWLQEPTYDYTPDEIYDEVEGDAVASDVWDTLIESVLPALRRGEGRVLGGLVHTVGSDTYTPTQRKAIFLAVEQGFKEADVMRFTASAVLEAGSPTVFWGHTLKMIDHIRHAFGTGQDRVIEDYVKMLKQAHASWGKTGWVTSGDIRFGMGTIPYGEKLPWFEKVGGDFTCANQRLTSLKGCPREVGGVFFASDNKLESLEGGPEIVGSDYYCDNNKLKTLKGAPKRIPGEFLAYDNDLKDLRGAPSFVGDGFSVANNALRSLEGGPKHVGGGYNAENNAVLTSIEGVATYIDGDFTCDSANLKSLEPLLKSTVTMHVDTRFGYFDSWPPPEGTKLTASSEVEASSQLEKWLRAPTYDYTPEEIYKEVEGKNGSFYSDLWDELIENILPPIRRGTYFRGGEIALGEAWIGAYTDNMLKALFYAIEDGYKEAGLFQVVVSTYFESTQKRTKKRTKQFLLKNYKKQIEKAFGTTDSKLVDSVVGVLNKSNAVFSPEGWVCKGDIDLSTKKLKRLPTFSSVGGSFYCGKNQLTTLEGAPREVGGYFYCDNNQLTTLKGAPREVGGDFYCGKNQLTTLEGAPREVGGYFSCYNNQLTTLEGAPREVGGDFYCSENQLTTLEGAPREVGRNFYCGKNQLTTLKGAPREVGGGFYCDNNQLKTLESLLNSEIRGTVKSDLGVFSTWPPPEGTKLTASSENLPVSPPRVAAPSLKRWLKSPTYDWMPDEIEQDLEDNAQAEIWDILIEEVLPSLRKGNKRLLESYRHVAVGAAWSLNQVMAFLYAIHKGFKEKDILNFLSTVLVGEKIGHAVLYDTPLERYNDILFGRSTSNLTATYTVLDLLVAVGARWTPKGWVVPTTTGVHLSGLRLDALPLFHEVKGTFNCSNNRLTNLKGSPRKVGSEFDCSSNRLTTLDGCPLEVEDSFLALHNDKLKSIKALLKTKIGGVVFTDFGDFTTWPPSPSDPLSHVASISVEASRASEDRWFRDPSYEGAPPRINKILDEMSVEQEMWYEIIDTYVPALRAGKKATLDYLLRTYEQYDADQMKVILYAAEQGFKHSGEHVALAANYLLFNPLTLAAHIAAPAFGVDIRKDSGPFNGLMRAFSSAKAHYTPQGWVVPDSLHIDSMGLVAVPPIASVKGDLFMQDNKLTSLEGCPRKVPGDFQCGGNQLTTLEGGPDWVGQDYYCYGNKLKDLRGAPSYVGNDFYAYHNPLKSLEGKPRHIGGLFEAE
jgi:hypothetical protein